MALHAGKIESKSKFKDQEPLDPGAYPARIVQIISLGLQPQMAYQGEEKDPKHEILVTYELLDEFMKDEEGNEIEDKPRWLSETLPLHSLDADLAKSTKRYLALDPLRNYGGDWSKLAGVPCMVTIINKKVKSGKNEGKIYDNVASISSMREKEAAKAPDLKNPPKVFDMDDPDMEVFGSLPQWMQDKMKGALDFDGSALDKAIKEGGVPEKNEEPSPEPESNDDAPEKEDW